MSCSHKTVFHTQSLVELVFKTLLMKIKQILKEESFKTSFALEISYTLHKWFSNSIIENISLADILYKTKPPFGNKPQINKQKGTNEANV